MRSIADIKLELAKRAANDPNRSFGSFAEIVQETGEKGTTMPPVHILPVNRIAIKLPIHSRTTAIRAEDERHVSSR